MKIAKFTLCALLLSIQAAMAQGKSKSVRIEPSLEQGRYMVLVAGCNDCHTPMYGPKNGEVPESDWLTGSPVGWMGPWGTTYPTNLRKRVANLTEDEWVQYLKNLKSRPPMPYYAVNAMSERDSRSLYRFIRSLGDHPQVIPSALPPHEKPKTPYVNFDVILPRSGQGI